jgi:RND family efflux transporter MFP subunit
MRPCIGVVAALLLGGCGAKDATPEHIVADSRQTEGATPVSVVPIRDTTLALTVSAPGHTEVLRPLHVRAPFTGTVTALAVADGDRVVAGDELGTFVSRSSAAALAGARAMVAAARTDAEQRDAQRALDLATASLVRTPLRAPESGVVVSHAANAGDLVSEGDDILVIAPAGAVSFIADVVQSDLPQVRPGQRVAVDLAARATPLAGRVHGILPAASAENLNAPVRIDLGRSAEAIGIGLFGTARITVGERRHVSVVPETAVLRDDVYGTTRIAVVGAGPEPRAHWVPVTTGVRDNGLVEIVSPRLDPTTQVIVTGLVGLPEGAPVHVQP